MKLWRFIFRIIWLFSLDRLGRCHFVWSVYKSTQPNIWRRQMRKTAIIVLFQLFDAQKHFLVIIVTHVQHITPFDQKNGGMTVPTASLLMFFIPKIVNGFWFSLVLFCFVLCCVVFIQSARTDSSQRSHTGPLDGHYSFYMDFFSLSRCWMCNISVHN